MLCVKGSYVLKITKIIIVLSFLFTLIGCSTSIARSDNGIGHSFIATEKNISSFKTVNGFTLKNFFPGLIITLPITLLDLGISVVTDIVMLPLDLAIEPDTKERIMNTSTGH